MDTRSLMARACPAINRVGPAFYFTPETVAVGRQHGLDGFRFYFLGRGGVLGDVEWPVVLSAFGYFKPSLVEKMWTTARERCPVRDAARAYLDCCADFGRASFAHLDDLDAFCEAAATVVEAALIDPAGLTLFAGLAAEAPAVDGPARAMQLVATLREFRGSAHLVAVAASGLPTPVAHRIDRPNDLAAFGWGEEEVRVPTDSDRARLTAADVLTDDLVAPAYAALGEEGALALLQGVEAMDAVLRPA